MYSYLKITILSVGCFTWANALYPTDQPVDNDLSSSRFGMPESLDPKKALTPTVSSPDDLCIQILERIDETVPKKDWADWWNDKPTDHNTLPPR